MAHTNAATSSKASERRGTSNVAPDLLIGGALVGGAVEAALFLLVCRRTARPSKSVTVPKPIVVA